MTVSSPWEVFDSPTHNKHTEWYTRTTSPPHARVKLIITIDIPAFGVVFMQPNDDARQHAELRGIDPVYIIRLNGELLIKFPTGCESVRYESVRLSFVTVCKVHGAPRSFLEDLAGSIAPHLSSNVDLGSEQHVLHKIDHFFEAGVIESEQR